MKAKKKKMASWPRLFPLPRSAVIPLSGKWQTLVQTHTKAGEAERIWLHGPSISHCFLALLRDGAGFTRSSCWSWCEDSSGSAWDSQISRWTVYEGRTREKISKNKSKRIKPVWDREVEERRGRGREISGRLCPPRIYFSPLATLKTHQKCRG